MTLSDPQPRPALEEPAAFEREALEVQRSRPFRWLVRAGFLARGVTYGVVGALALALALGAGSDGTAPNQQGALSLIDRVPLGQAALVVIALGLLAYALWKLGQGLLGRGPEGGGGTDVKDRVANFAGGVVYLGFFAVSIRVLTGSAGSQSAESRRATSGVLGWPGGRVLVGLAGAGLLAVSLFQVYEAIRGKFVADSNVGEMKPVARRLLMVFGRLGLVSRALVFALIGYFLLKTAIGFNAARAVSVDGALEELHRQPMGPWLLALVAAGLMVFAAFSLMEARYRRL